MAEFSSTYLGVYHIRSLLLVTKSLFRENRHNLFKIYQGQSYRKTKNGSKIIQIGRRDVTQSQSSIQKSARVKFFFEN